MTSDSSGVTPRVFKGRWDTRRPRNQEILCQLSNSLGTERPHRKTRDSAASFLESPSCWRNHANSGLCQSAVRNLQDSIYFYESLGFPKNPQFSDETVASFDISELIHLMLATHDKFSELTPRQIADPSKVCHSLLSMLCESREEVDSLVSKAIAAGGSAAMSQKTMASLSVRILRSRWPWLGSLLV